MSLIAQDDLVWWGDKLPTARCEESDLETRSRSGGLEEPVRGEFKVATKYAQGSEETNLLTLCKRGGGD